MKSIIFCLALLPLAANASNITLANSPVGPQVVTFSRVLIGNGNLVRIGTLTVPGLASSFVEFGTSTTLSVGPGTSRVSGTAVNTGGEADDAQFNAKDVYLWIYSTPTASATADQGLFRATAGTPAWVFPTDGGALDTVTLGVANINSALDIPGFTGAAVQAAGAEGNTLTNTALRLGTVAVPEPSASLLALVALGFITRRKR
jgi:hypothetical protein